MIKTSKMKDKGRLKKIYEKTDGNCHLCHKKLSFSNYGNRGGRGAWNIEHSKAKANGGKDHLNNLFPACIKCNTEKGTLHTKIVRKRNGVTRAPLSKPQKAKIKANNTAFGIAAGAIAGIPLGPGGMFIGGLIGGWIGDSSSPKK
jgi:5-methylcytosine-specific restriction endonuclease McrA